MREIPRATATRDGAGDDTAGRAKPVSAPVFFAILVFVALNLSSSPGKTTTAPATATTTTTSGSGGGCGGSSVIIGHAYETTLPVFDIDWIGDRWHHPRAMSPREMIRVFAEENTLVWGDSTGRQDYFTLLPLITTNGLNHRRSGAIVGDDDNITTTNNTNINININDTNPTDITVADLEMDLNRGKAAQFISDRNTCPVRQVPTRGDTAFFRHLAQVEGTERGCDPCGGSDQTATNKSKADGFPNFADDTAIETKDGSDEVAWRSFAAPDQPRGKIDYAAGTCMIGFLSGALQNEAYVKILRREYSVIVVATGIWDVASAYMCDQDRPHTVGNETYDWAIRVLPDLLDALDELSGPGLFVVWKMHGDHDASVRGKQKFRTDYIRTTVLDWFGSRRPLHMDLADFGGAVATRSLREDRIAGDLNPHWGLEARLLAIDLVANVVRSKQSRDRINRPAPSPSPPSSSWWWWWS